MKRKIVAAVCSALIIAVIPLFTALAHGSTEVGDYKIEIGFHNEPTYAGEPNGLDLFVTNMKTNEPVKGLEETLQVEISWGAYTKELKIEPQEGLDGAYTAYVLPVEAGDYTWHIWGQIEGTPVDVSMTSSPNTFEPVESKSSIEFPNAEPSLQELSGKITLALAVGIIGVVLGGIGILVGTSATRKKR